VSSTPEQIAADDALAAAIEAVHQAYYPGDVRGVLTKFVVLAQRQWWNDSDEPVTANWASPRGDTVPISDLLGLCEYASTRYRKIIAED